MGNHVRDLTGMRVGKLIVREDVGSNEQRYCDYSLNL